MSHVVSTGNATASDKRGTGILNVFVPCVDRGDATGSVNVSCCVNRGDATGSVNVS